MWGCLCASQLTLCILQVDVIWQSQLHAEQLHGVKMTNSRAICALPQASHHQAVILSRHPKASLSVDCQRHAYATARSWLALHWAFRPACRRIASISVVTRCITESFIFWNLLVEAWSHHAQLCKLGYTIYIRKFDLYQCNRSRLATPPSVWSSAWKRGDSSKK